MWHVDTSFFSCVVQRKGDLLHELCSLPCLAQRGGGIVSTVQVERDQDKAEDGINEQGFTRVKHLVYKSKSQESKQATNEQYRAVCSFLLCPTDKEVEADAEQERKNHKKA